MSAIKNISGTAVPVYGNDIDTDRIIPARFLKAVTFEGMGEHAFEDARKQNPEHPFNDPRYRGAAVLIHPWDRMGTDTMPRYWMPWLVGMSYQWWMTKHTRHHANPNTEGKDPDIAWDTVSFTAEDAARQRGLLAVITRRQGYLFFPLLLLEGVNLHVTSIRSLLARGPVERRTPGLVAIGLRRSIYLTIVFLMLPVGMGFAFLGVQLAVFGVYMGASFAPNHKGMPLLPAGSRVDFLNKQVLTSRNIRGGWSMSVFMGGLNHQIEHHLFPSMPRPHLRRARELVREHCRAHDIPYTETGLVTSYRIVIQYLNRVGLSARDPFDCPAASRYRRA